MKPRRFPSRTVRLPWMPECRDFFGLPSDEQDPDSYTITITATRAVWKCTARGVGTWRTDYVRRMENPLPYFLKACVGEAAR